MDLKKLFTNMGIFGIFTFSILVFAVFVQNENEVNTPITDHTVINDTYNDLSENLISSSSQTKASLGNFENITPTQQYGELEVTSIISPTKIMKTIILGFWNIFVKLPQAVLGVDESIAGLISSLILIFIIIGIWAIWKGAISI